MSGLSYRHVAERLRRAPRYDQVETETLDILELELRQVPWVVGVGIEEVAHTLTVHLMTASPAPHASLLRSASEIARHHTTGQVVLTVTVCAPPPEAGAVEALPSR